MYSTYYPSERKGMITVARTSRYSIVYNKIAELLKATDPDTVKRLLDYLHTLTNQQLNIEPYVQTSYDAFPSYGERRQWAISDLSRRIMAELVETGKVPSQARPITSGVHGAISLLKHHSNGQPMTITFINDDSRSETIAVTIRKQMDDDGPWVGQLANDSSSWLLISWGRDFAFGGGWILYFRDERPKDWFEFK
jgi:hypothetical protein